MNTINRFILDLDGTLWEQDFEEENKFFKRALTEKEYKKFIPLKGKIFTKYEKENKRYDIKKLSKFLQKETGISFTEEILQNWLEFNGASKTVLNEGTMELLEYLKEKKKSIVALSNRFQIEQEKRLENLGILHYFDVIYGGDTYIKPNIESYINASGMYPLEQCVVIGDNLIKDVLTPRALGMDAVYYNKNLIGESNIDKTVKTLTKIKEFY